MRNRISVLVMKEKTTLAIVMFLLFYCYATAPGFHSAGPHTASKSHKIISATYTSYI